MGIYSYKDIKNLKNYPYFRGLLCVIIDQNESLRFNFCPFFPFTLYRGFSLGSYA